MWKYSRIYNLPNRKGKRAGFEENGKIIEIMKQKSETNRDYNILYLSFGGISVIWLSNKNAAVLNDRFRAMHGKKYAKISIYLGL